MKYSNLIYFSYLNSIGGIETWLYNLSELYKEKDVTIVINQGSKPQIDRIKRNFRLIIWDGKRTFECENLFVCFNLNIIPFVNADKVYCVLHGDYEDMVNRKQLSKEALPINNRINEYIGITKNVCESWERLTGINARLCYNPVYLADESKTIRICSAQRMTREKGRERIIKLADSLDLVCKNTGYKYIWDIYTDDRRPIHKESIYYKLPRLDIQQLYKGYDWFVALSDNEGYCYSVVENLMQGVPCVVTDLPVFEELNLNDENSLKLNLDCSNTLEVATKMFKEKKVFKYKPPKDEWGFLFGDNESTYSFKEEKIMKYKVEALRTYTDLNVKDGELDKIIPEGFQFEVDENRLNVLLGNNTYKKAFVKLVEEPKKEIEEKIEEVVEEIKEEIIEQQEQSEDKPKKKSKKKNK